MTHKRPDTHSDGQSTERDHPGTRIPAATARFGGAAESDSLDDAPSPHRIEIGRAKYGSTVVIPASVRAPRLDTAARGASDSDNDSESPTLADSERRGEQR